MAVFTQVILTAQSDQTFSCLVHSLTGHCCSVCPLYHIQWGIEVFLAVTDKLQPRNADIGEFKSLTPADLWHTESLLFADCNSVLRYPAKVSVHTYLGDSFLCTRIFQEHSLCMPTPYHI